MEQQIIQEKALWVWMTLTKINPITSAPQEITGGQKALKKTSRPVLTAESTYLKHNIQSLQWKQKHFQYQQHDDDRSDKNMSVSHSDTDVTEPEIQTDTRAHTQTKRTRNVCAGMHLLNLSTITHSLCLFIAARFKPATLCS